MIPIVRLKQNLDFNKNLSELIEAMKLAATLRFNQFRLSRQPSQDAASMLEKMFSCISEKNSRNMFLNSRTETPQAIVLVSSDEGFLGELNALLVDKLIGIRQDNDRIIVLGQQGANYLEELKIDFKLLPSITDKLELNQIEALADYILQLYVKQKVYKVCVIYARFVNITSQQVETEVLLPLSTSAFLQSVPVKKKQEFLIEPGLDSVIEVWVKLWLFSRFNHVFWSSKLAEFAARIMHLEGSIQELTRINQRLNLEYFKYLHALSDKTIREIYASRLIRKAG